VGLHWLISDCRCSLRELTFLVTDLFVADPARVQGRFLVADPARVQLQEDLSRKSNLLLALLFVTLLLTAGRLHADPPKITRALPSGGQVGKSHDVELKGTFATWPAQFWTDSTDLSIQPSETSGKVKVIVAPEATPGVRYFRAYDATGASELTPFIVDRCADLLEVEPNDHHAQSQVVEQLPISIHGVLQKSGDVDSYQVTLEKGQTLVASVDGKRFLGSPMDADLQVLSANGVVLAQNFDHHGLDPELKFTATASGKYLVRVLAFPETPDSTIAYSGSDKYLYRLMLTNGPFIETCVPACLSQLTENTLQMRGANIPADKQSFTIPSIRSPESDRAWFSQPGFQGILSLPVTSAQVIVESEPNEKSAPEQVAIPSIVTGRIETRGDIDAFQLQCKSGQRLQFRVEAQEYGSPLDAVLTVLNSEGKQLATGDDVGENRDTTLAFAAPADGAFTVTVHDMYRHYGADHWYRLFIEADEPSYTLSTTSSSFAGKVGQPLEIVVNVARRLDFAGDISLGIEPTLSTGSCPPVISKKADDSGKSVKLIVQSAEPLAIPIRITGQSDPGIKRLAKPDKSDTSWLWLTIAP
jgi:Bacterial pre-peptidase C-terminal domain